MLGVEHPVSRVMFTPLNSLHSSAGLVGEKKRDFNRMMKGIWFKLYSRTDGVKKTTSNFEHIFMGEVRNKTG